ncbi:ABC transporter ATP-binding protein, partial [Pseudomonas sp. BGM005]|nr:ABC transporter ATP-binding protein [Pseudomonas sp. BG5]
MTDTQDPFIALAGVKKAFRIGTETIPIFSGLDLAMPRGDFVAV